MDSFEFNKLIGALLGVVFIVFSVSIISDSIFASPVPEKEGFLIEATEPEAGGRLKRPRRKSRSLNCSPRPTPAAGEAVFKKCAGVPHGREWRPQQGRPQPLGHRRTGRSPRMKASPIRRP